VTSVEEQNLELVQKWANTWNDEIDRMVDECYGPDCAVESSGHVLHGRDELRAIEYKVLEAAPKRKMEIKRTIAVGDTVVVEIDLFDLGDRPELKKSRACIVLRIRDGMIYSDHSYGPGSNNVIKHD
jgi:hypothetical protein